MPSEFLSYLPDLEAKQIINTDNTVTGYPIILLFSWSIKRLDLEVGTVRVGLEYGKETPLNLNIIREVLSNVSILFPYKSNINNDPHKLLNGPCTIFGTGLLSSSEIIRERYNISRLVITIMNIIPTLTSDSYNLISNPNSIFLSGVKDQIVYGPQCDNVYNPYVNGFHYLWEAHYSENYVRGILSQLGSEYNESKVRDDLKYYLKISNLKLPNE